jgi:hypothetical protein
VRELAQLGHRVLRFVERLGDERLGVVLRALSELERDDRVDKALLRPVVKVPHDAAALVVGGGDHPRARRGEVGTRLGRSRSRSRRAR